MEENNNINENVEPTFAPTPQPVPMAEPSVPVETPIVPEESTEPNNSDEKPKKKGLGIIIILLLIILGSGGYVGYKKIIDKEPNNTGEKALQNNKEEKEPTNDNHTTNTEADEDGESNTNNQGNSNTSTDLLIVNEQEGNVTSIEKIKEIAKSGIFKKSYIDTDINYELAIGDYCDDDCEKAIAQLDDDEDIDVEIKIGFSNYDNSTLMLYYQNHKSIVSNFKAHIVGIYSAYEGCAYPTSDFLILTTNGNLYLVRLYYPENHPNSYQHINGLEGVTNNSSVNIYFKKINTDAVRVLAVTNDYQQIHDGIEGDEDTCDYYGRMVYANDGTLRSYEDFEIVKRVK